MKQTVEKASIEYAESVIRSFGTCGVPIGISDIKEMIVNGFNSGTEGQFSDSDKKTAENFGIDYMDVSEFVNVYGEGV